MLIFASALGFMLFTSSRPRAAILWAYLGFFALFGGLLWFETRNQLTPKDLAAEFQVVPQLTAVVSQPSDPEPSEVLDFLRGFDGTDDAEAKVTAILPEVEAGTRRVWLLDTKLDPEEVMTFQLLEPPDGWGFTQWSRSHVYFTGHGEEALVAIEKRSYGSRVAYILPAEPGP